MRRSFAADDRGATAIEFAFVCPIILIGGLAAAAFGLFAWQQSVLDTVTAEAARCSAIASRDCAPERTGCGSEQAVACFARSRAEALGLPGLRLSDIAAHRRVLPSGLQMTSVTIRHDTSIAGYSVPLTASASFPVP